MPMTFDGAKMNEIRLRRGWTWRRLVEVTTKMGWPVSERYLHSVMRNGYVPRPEHLSALADALGCRVGDFYVDASVVGAKGDK